MINFLIYTNNDFKVGKSISPRIIIINDDYSTKQGYLSDFKVEVITNSCEANINTDNNYIIAQQQGELLLKLSYNTLNKYYSVIFSDNIDYTDTVDNILNQIVSEKATGLYQPVGINNLIDTSISTEFQKSLDSLDKVKFTTLFWKNNNATLNQIGNGNFNEIANNITIDNTLQNMAYNISYILAELYNIPAYAYIKNGNNIVRVPEGILFGTLVDGVHNGGRAIFQNTYNQSVKSPYFIFADLDSLLTVYNIIIYTSDTSLITSKIKQDLEWFLNKFYMIIISKNNDLDSFIQVTDISPFNTDKKITYFNDINLTGYYCIKYDKTSPSYQYALYPTINYNNIIELIPSTTKLVLDAFVKIDFKIKLLDGTVINYNGLISSAQNGDSLVFDNQITSLKIKAVKDKDSYTAFIGITTYQSTFSVKFTL